MGRDIELIGPPIIGVGLDRSARGFYIVYTRGTKWANVIWQWWLVLRLGWPPVRYLKAFILED